MRVISVERARLVGGHPKCQRRESTSVIGHLSAALFRRTEQKLLSSHPGREREHS